MKVTILSLLIDHVEFLPLRSLNAICGKNGTILAKITRATLKQLQVENKDLSHVIERILLQASVKELASYDVA